ncbi:hypothetical protein EfmAA242_27900 [Enterococcus faecium]|nr:hypothetical protein EfmAA242_27900 [Enterococcus faecium]
MKKIRDLVIDEQFEQFVLIKSADVRIAKNGKKFIAFTFQDTSGTILKTFTRRGRRNSNAFTKCCYSKYSKKRKKGIWDFR